MRSPARALLIIVLAVGVIATASPASASAGRDYADQRLQAGIDALVTRPDGPPGVIAVVQRGDARPRVPRRCLEPEDRRSHATVVAHADRQHRQGVQRWRRTVTGRGGRDVPRRHGRRAPSLDDPDWHAVTLAQVLHHTSGIPDVLDSTAFIDAVIASPHDDPVAPEAVELPQHEDLRFRRTVPTSTRTPTTSWSG